MYTLSIFFHICACSIWLYKPRKSSYGLANLELFNQHLLEDPPPTKKTHLPIINSPVVVGFPGKKLKIFSKSSVFWDLIHVWDSGCCYPAWYTYKKRYRKWPSRNSGWLPMNSMVIFHSYVKLPEGLCATVKFYVFDRSKHHDRNGKMGIWKIPHEN